MKVYIGGMWRNANQQRIWRRKAMSNWRTRQPIVLAWCVGPKWSCTTSSRWNVSCLSYMMGSTLIDWSLSSSALQLGIEEAYANRGHCLTVWVGNMYLPPVKTIDTFFLHQVMKGEKLICCDSCLRGSLS